MSRRQISIIILIILPKIWEETVIKAEIWLSAWITFKGLSLSKNDKRPFFLERLFSYKNVSRAFKFIELFVSYKNLKKKICSLHSHILIARFARKIERAWGARPNGRRASRSDICELRASQRLAFWFKLPSFSRTISELLLLKKWLNYFLFEIKRVINLLKALSPLRNTFSSQYSRFALDFT